MADGELVVDFRALQQASADIGQALRTLGSQLHQVEREAAPLVATWEGAARQAYEQRQARWRGAAQNLQALLREIKVAVDESAADYLSTERRNADLFR
ncbi:MULTISPECIES: WXG100 family type VII secretion target [Micromonosporaceae]|uniref:WXG100 family type VII secretion target n=1 Tax=Micromonosporaceae TaxID=28056 RepID=UPI002416C9B1|nr:MULTISPECIES: WXG100 family type VII secretion target [unclassified Solwaraspora]MDG4774425.1 WXG100 family type VII secretion target [Solwaraspora sp. WMMD792]WFE23083.1 WXG100 family type VII secretion target [Solwaraspora sp. WMMD937]